MWWNTSVTGQLKGLGFSDQEGARPVLFTTVCVTFVAGFFLSACFDMLRFFTALFTADKRTFLLFFSFSVFI